MRRASCITGWMLATLTLQACALIAPLEDVRVSSAGRRSPETGGASPPPEVAADGGRDSGVDAGRSCELNAQLACDPVLQCGCPFGRFCTLTDDETAIACVTHGGGRKARGEPCQFTSECLPGLQCPLTRVCSPYCTRDADCGMGERCLPFENESLQQTLAGTGSCQIVCDPVSDEICPENMRCQPSHAERKVHFAVCKSIETVGFTPRGGSCTELADLCEPKHACSHFGQELCLPLCRTDRDCPSELPRCYVVDRLATPDDKLGDCWYAPCDDSTVPEPTDWAEGPVATASELTDCQSVCGPRLSADLSCVEQNCVKNLARCVAQGQDACAAAKYGPCRGEYVGASCVDWRARRNRSLEYTSCVQAQLQCSSQAQRACTKP